MEELARDKISVLVFLNGLLKREGIDYVMKDNQPHFHEPKEGRIDVVTLPSAIQVVTYVAENKSNSKVSGKEERLPKRMVVSDYDVLIDCLTECKESITVKDAPDLDMFGFVAVETGDSWLISSANMRRTGPEMAMVDKFREAMAITHNELLKRI